MSDEQMKILEMLEGGKITSEEATQLLNAIKPPAAHISRPEEPAIFEQPISETLPVREEIDIDLSHSHGDITVKGWDKDEVRLEGKKTVRAVDQATALMYAEQMKVELKSNERRITVRTLRPEPEASWQVKQRTINYELYAPHRFSVTLHNEHGGIQTEHFAGDLAVNSRHGSLQVEGFGKNAAIQHAHGHIEVSQIDGDASIKKIHGNLKIKEINGKLKLRQEHGQTDLSKIGKAIDISKRHGNLNIDAAAGALQIDHEHGHLQLYGIGGDVEVRKSHGNADIEDIKGCLTLSSRDGHLDAVNIQGNLHARGIRGNASIDNVLGTADIVHAQGHVLIRNVGDTVAIHNRQGNIEATAPHPVTHPYRLHAEHANLTLLMPDNAQIDLSAQTEHGRIDTDLPLTITKKKHMETAEGSLNGGGIEFELSNHHGNIQIDTVPVSSEKQSD